MCIIIYKPKKQFLPDNSIVKNCLINNPDGAGYMFNIPSKGVFIKKGFSSAKALRKSLNAKLFDFGLHEQDVSIVIHARIATAGKVKAENCHPFPITDNISLLQSTEIISEKGFAHNGVISITDKKNENLSDSQIFVKDILANFSNCDFEKDHIKKLLKISLKGSRVIALDEKGYLFSFGDFEKDKNIYYSNTTYKQEKYTYKNKYMSNDYYDRFCGSVYGSGYDYNKYTGQVYGKNSNKSKYADKNVVTKCEFCDTDHQVDDLEAYEGLLLCETCIEFCENEYSNNLHYNNNVDYKEND